MLISRSLGTSQLLSVADSSLVGTGSPLLSGGKPLALLAFLLAAPGRTASRDQLIELLWADVERDAARHTLRQTLWYLRKRANTDVVVGTSDMVRIGVPVENDRQRFLDRLESGELELAIAEYAGDFFPEFASPGAAAFEHWADVERQRLRGLYLGAVTAVVGARLQLGRAREALTLARQAREKVPATQATARLVIECLIAAGDAVSAKLEAEQLMRALEQEEDEPDAATNALLRRVLQERNEPPNAGTPADDHRLTTELVGRDAAFAALLRAFEKARRGTPVHMHISAAAGFGKTRLLDGLAGRLLTQRARIVTVRAIPAERSIAFAFVSQLASALVPLRGAAAISPGAASTIVALAPAASSYLSATPDRADADEAQRRRTLALVELLAAVAEDSHVVLLIDDVHWMDEPSKQMLAALAERVQQGKLLLVTTARPVDRFVDLTPSAERLTLDPLSIEDTAALLASVATLPSEPWADLLPARLHTATAGSPLLIIETLQLALERELLTSTNGQWGCESPSELLAILGTGKAIQQRLSALPASAGDALLAMAIIGEPVTEDTLSTVLGLADIRDATSILDARGLAVRVNDTWRPAHDEIAALVVDLSSDRRRTEMHRAIGDWLEQQPTKTNAWPFARATWHRARSGDRTGMARTFTRFVERTRAMGLATPAVELARDALGVEASDSELQQLTAMLPRRLRSRVHRWLPRIAAAAACFAAGAIALGGDRSGVPPDVTFDMYVTDLQNRTHWARGGVTLATLASGKSIDIEETAALVTPGQQRAYDSTGVAAPLLTEDGVSDVYVDTLNAIDVVDVDAEGSQRPLVAKPHDQTLPKVSPDGRLVAFLDRDYWPSQSAEIGLVDRRTREVRRLTNSPNGVLSMVWSPDGSELAFLREGADTLPRELCRMDVTGANVRCATVKAPAVPMNILAWRADDQVLLYAIGTRTDRGVLVLTSFDGRDARVIDDGGTWYFVDPTGSLAICTCRVRGFDRPVVTAFAIDQPATKRELRLGGALLRDVDGRQLRWTTPRETAFRIEVNAIDSIMLGESVRLSVRGLTSRNREVSIANRRWRSLDTTIATVDDRGDVRARRTGVVQLVVASGLSLTDTVSLRIVAPRVRSVLEERWQEPLDGRWYGFGQPRPLIAATPTGPRLRINGDEVLVSGVISREAFSATRGIGVRVRFAITINRPTWQGLSVALRPLATDSAITVWRFNDGDAMPDSWNTDVTHQCQLRLPQREGLAFRGMVALSARGEPVSRREEVPTFGDGRIHEIQIQRFSDGRCAFVLDDVLLAVSDVTAPTDRPLRVVIEGQSVGTTTEVLEVEAWQGVRSNGVWAGLRPR